MSERNCSEPSCCNGTQWPDCAQTAGMPVPGPIKARPVATWETNTPSYYTTDPGTPWRYTYPATD